MVYQVEFTKKAAKDVKKLSPKLVVKLKEILRNKIAVAPYSGKPLVGDLKGYYSVRLSYQDRVVYTIDDTKVLVTVIRARSHYGE